ncbi:MAG: Trm112 family protein [bacterium]
MALSQKLLEKMVCPACKGSLSYEEELNRLVCPTCNLGYRIVDDIPVMLVDEAEKL